MASPPKNMDYYVIRSGRPNYVMIDMLQNAGYAALYKAQKEGSLPKVKNTQIIPRAALFQTPDMLIKEVEDEETGQVTTEFLPEVKLLEADSEGRIWVPKDKAHLARKLLRDLRAIDKKVILDPAYLMLDEEVPEESRSPKNMGGRPPKKPTY